MMRHSTRRSGAMAPSADIRFDSMTTQHKYCHNIPGSSTVSAPNRKHIRIPHTQSKHLRSGTNNRDSQSSSAASERHHYLTSHPICDCQHDVTSRFIGSGCQPEQNSPTVVADNRNDVEAQHTSSQADRCNWNRQRTSRCGNRDNTPRTSARVHKQSAQSLSSPLETYTGDPILDSLRDRLSITKRQADNDETIISVIDELTTYIQRRSYSGRGAWNRRHRRSDVGATRKQYQSNIRSRNKSQKLSASTHNTSEFPEHCIIGTSPTRDDAIGMSDADIYASASACNVTDSDTIVRDTNSPRIADSYDINVGNYTPFGKDERCKQTRESVTSSNAPLFSCSLHETVVNDQHTSVNCGANHDSFIVDNSDMRPTMRGNSAVTHAIPKGQRRKWNLEIDSVVCASHANEDLCFKEIVGDLDECTPAGLSFCDVNANCSTGSSTFDVLVHLSDDDFAFDVMHSSLSDETVALNCENAVTDPLSHLLETDRLSTSTECTDSSNGCMNQSDVIRHDYFRNEDALELFQNNTSHFSSQIETTTNGFAFLDEQACPVNLSEHNSATTSNDVYLSNNRSQCAFNLKSNMNRNILHNNVLIAGASDAMCDYRCIIESWDASIEYICDSDQITELYSSWAENQGLSPPHTPSSRCTSNSCLKSSGCDLTVGASNDVGSVMNLSDFESVSDCSMLSSIQYADHSIANDPIICKTFDSQYTPMGCDCTLAHDNISIAFRSDCSSSERYEDHLATNSSRQQPACYDFMRADPASRDYCDISTNDVSSAIPHHTCQMPHGACCAANDLVKSDLAADKHVNEALDLLLSIMESN